MRQGLSVLAAAAGLLAACRGTGPARAPSGPAQSLLRVGLQEFAVVTSGATLTTGPVRVAVTNTGSTLHDLRLRQGGRTIGQTPLLEAGGRTDLTVTVAGGLPVELDCTVRGHAAAGMRLDLAAAP